jgi:hypothetical protein
LPRVMVRCPMTEHLIPTGYESDGSRGFRSRLPRSTIVLCDSCRRTHAWYREEAILEGTERRERREIAG